MPAKCHYKPSASRAISCRRPVVPRSIPVLSSSSLSRNELAVEESERSVTCPTFIGRPASSKPFSCSNAFFAHSASANFRKLKGYKVNPAANKKLPKTYKGFVYRYEAISFGSASLAVHHKLDSFNLWRRNTCRWLYYVHLHTLKQINLCRVLLTFPKGSKIPRSISSVMLKCSEPTYRRIGPELPFCRLLAAAAALFFSACN